MPSSLEVDYLIIGSGAMGMAFADTLVSDSTATMAVVDRNDAPGGHWTMSYPFVRLHGPSGIYGVNSRPMHSDGTPTSVTMASQHEVLDYYDRVMRKVLVDSGRVTHLPRHEVVAHTPGATTVQVRNLLGGAVTEIVARRRVVDASYMNITVPAMGKRGYAVDDGVALVRSGSYPRGMVPRSTLRSSEQVRPRSMPVYGCSTTV